MSVAETSQYYSGRMERRTTNIASSLVSESSKALSGEQCTVAVLRAQVL